MIPIPTLQPGEKLPVGIYFDLPEDTYHADDGLGSTALKRIVVDPYDWQFDRLHEDEPDTEALQFGQALHARMLVGRSELEANFAPTFDKKPFSGALDTVSDMKEWLTLKGQRNLSSRKKDDLIRRVLEIDPHQPIIDVLKRNWDERHAGKTFLKPKRWAQIEVAARFVQSDPLLSAVMQDGTFIDGAPEVSVIFETNGVRRKARFDRLLRHAIVDLKSFTPMFFARLEWNALSVIDRMRYDIQAAAYRLAWKWAKEQYLDGTLQIYGAQPFDGFLSETFDRDYPDWIWIFVKTKSAPQPLVVAWDAEIANATAEMLVEDAVNTYRTLSEKFGTHVEWMPERAALRLTDADLPTHFGNKIR